MKKYVMFYILIMTFHPSFIRCEQPAGFSVSDSLFNNKLFLQAIAEYSRYLSSDKADYALYKIGLSKKEIAEFCVSENQFDKYPEMYRKKYLESYPESHIRDKVIDLCLDDYYNVLGSWEFSDSLKTKYEKEIEEFKQR